MYDIIGIRGSGIGCGKDTVTRLLMDELATHGYVYEHRKFADPIRDVIAILTGYDRAYTERTEGKATFIRKAGKTVGKLLQDVGSAMKQIVHDEVWVDAALVDSDRSHLIFSDVRFPKELQAIKERGGTIIEVRRSKVVSDQVIAGRSVLHESETALNGIPSDIIIDNNGTIDDLCMQVSTVVDRLLRAKNGSGEGESSSKPQEQHEDTK